MTRKPQRRTKLPTLPALRILIALTVAAGAVWTLGVGQTAAAPTSLPANCHAVAGELPNLCPSTPTAASDGTHKPQLQVRSDGTLRYHFDAVLWNGGGAFQLEGSACDSSQCPKVTQRIWEGDGEPGGSSRREPISGGRLIIEVGDGHHHYHYENAALYELLVPGGQSRATAKIGFCMFDTFPDPDGEITANYYPASSGPCSRSGSSVAMGISRGWGDYYPLNIANQWIVVNGLPAGSYTLRSTINPGREFIEADYDDNVLEETRTIPGATAADIAIDAAAAAPTVVELNGTVEGRDVDVVYQGGPTHTSAGPVLKFEILTLPQHGTLTSLLRTGNTTAEVTYTPSPDFAGSDSFTYRTEDDRNLDSHPATVTIGSSGAPANNGRPTVIGAPVLGEKLTSSPGSWSGEGPLAFAYQWQRCDTSGANCVNLVTPTTNTHLVGSGDVGSTIRVIVAASNGSGSVAAVSDTTATVTASPVLSQTSATGAGDPTRSGSATGPTLATAAPARTR